MSYASAGRFVLLAALWGSSFTFIKLGLEGTTPTQLVVGRLLFGLVVLLSIVAIRRVPLPKRLRTWGHVAVAGSFAMIAPFLLLAWGEQHTGAGIAGVLIGSTPLLTLAIATTVLPSERATWRKAAGLIVGFLGVVLVLSPWREAAGSLTGQLACLGAALGYAISFVYVRKFISPLGLAPLGLATAQLTLTLVAMIVAALVAHEPAPSLSLSVLASLAALGALGTGFGYVLFYRLIADTGATTASAVNYLVPVAAVLIAAISLGEAVTLNVVTGGILVILGVAYAEGRLNVSTARELAARSMRPRATRLRGNASSQPR